MVKFFFLMLYKIPSFAVFIYGNVTMISIKISDFMGATAFNLAYGHTSVFRISVTILYPTVECRASL